MNSVSQRTLSSRWLARMPTLSLALALAVAAATVSAHTSLGVMAGTVLDAHGKPLAGATVTMQTSDAHNAHATHTDADGRFQFLRYPPGQYDLRAYSGGTFSEWSKRILIRTGKTTEITLHVETTAAFGAPQASGTPAVTRGSGAQTGR